MLHILDFYIRLQDPFKMMHLPILYRALHYDCVRQQLSFKTESRKRLNCPGLKLADDEKAFQFCDSFCQKVAL